MAYHIPTWKRRLVNLLVGFIRKLPLVLSGQTCVCKLEADGKIVHNGPLLDIQGSSRSTPSNNDISYIKIYNGSSLPDGSPTVYGTPAYWIPASSTRDLPRLTRLYMRNRKQFHPLNHLERLPKIRGSTTFANCLTCNTHYR
jgi:hypothetical protein